MGLDRRARALLNSLIDSICHPRARRDPRWWLVDTLLHWAVERDLPPQVRARKTLTYTVLPNLLRRLRRWSGSR